LPLPTLEAFKDHGQVARTVDTPEAIAQARGVMAELAAVGIDMQAVTLQLQKEGVKLFGDSFDQLIERLEERRRALAPA
jgi:transaldolase